MMDEKARELITEELKKRCEDAGLKEEFAQAFREKLFADEGMFEEWKYFSETGNFLCKEKISEYSVVDILIWQMDHFRATMDRDNSRTKQNKDRMVLLAFDTFMKMKKNPEDYLQKLTGETGTDFQIP